MAMITVGTIIFGKAQFFLFGMSLSYFANWLAERSEKRH